MDKKTAVTAAKEVGKQKVELTQAELISLLRIDLESGLWPVPQKAAAALAALDAATAEIVQLKAVIQSTAVAEAPFADQVKMCNES